MNRQRLKGTMIGVAPPSPGAAAPPFGAPQPSPAAPPVAPMAQQAAPAPQRFGALAPTAAMPAVNSPPTAAMAGFGNPPPGGSVNPLGGTMVAPNAGSPRGPAFDSAAGAGMDIPVDLRDSAVLGHSPMGAGTPPFGGAPAAYGAGPAYGAAPAYGAEAAGPGMATGPMPMSDGYMPQTQSGAGMAGMGGFSPGGSLSKFKERSPLMVVFLALITCGIYSVLWFAKTADEIREQGQELPPSWHLIIPVLNLIWIWRWCEALERVSNGQERAATTFFIHFFLGPIGMAIVQSKLNDL